MVWPHRLGQCAVIIALLLGTSPSDVGALAGVENAIGNPMVSETHPAAKLNEPRLLYVTEVQDCPPPSPELSFAPTALSPWHAFNGFIGCMAELILSDRNAAVNHLNTMTEPWGRALALLTFAAAMNANPELDGTLLGTAKKYIRRVENVRARSEAYILLAAGYVRVDATSEAYKAITDAYTTAVSISDQSSRDWILRTLVLFLVAPDKMREPPSAFAEDWFALRGLVSSKTLDISEIGGPLALKAAKEIDKASTRTKAFIEIARAFAQHDESDAAEEAFTLAEQTALKADRVLVADLVREIAEIRLAVLDTPQDQLETQDLTERLVVTKECEGCDLSKLNFDGLDLNQARLTDANLDWASFRGANLARANLANTRLRGADLSGADLQGADLTRAYLSEADLSRANLRGANLFAANLSGSSPYVADLSKADLRSANLFGVSGSYADFSDSDLRGANLSRGVFWEANFVNADLRNANLSGAKFYKADFSGADLRGANLKGAFLKRANLRGAILDGVDLSGANLDGAILD